MFPFLKKVGSGLALKKTSMCLQVKNGWLLVLGLLGRKMQAFIDRPHCLLDTTHTKVYLSRLLHIPSIIHIYYDALSGYHTQARHSGNATPLRTMNSLSAIQAEHGIDGEGEEEEWETEIRGWRESEEVSFPFLGMIYFFSIIQSN